MFAAIVESKPQNPTAENVHTVHIPINVTNLLRHKKIPCNQSATGYLYQLLNAKTYIWR